MPTTPVLKKYVASLRGVGPGGIPVAAPDGVRLHGTTLAVHYSLILEPSAATARLSLLTAFEDDDAGMLGRR